MSSKTALVTGASSGIGAATARKLHELGYVVYGAARRLDKMKDLADQGIRLIELDVTDEDSLQAAVRRIHEETGRIDVLVNNAGYGSYGAVEDVPLSEARYQFEVNVFGAARLIQLVLPGIRAQRSGTIVNVSSMGGKIYSPFGGWYHGTKFALEALSDCLRLETRPFGVNVVLIEPGGIRTEWGGIAAGNLRKTSSSGPYAAQADAMAGSMDSEASERRNSPPEVVADTIAAAVSARHPRTRYATGFAAKPLIALRHLLPARAFDAVIRRATGLPA
ncbi:oxidoreductase [Kribbella sp. NPDC055071]